MQNDDRVCATRMITESGRLPGDPAAKFPSATYIHAVPGDFGTIIGVDDGVPTVRFDRTGTATIVCSNCEITPPLEVN